MNIGTTEYPQISSRRQFLRRTLAAGAAAATGVSALPVRGQPNGLITTQLSDGVFVVRGPDANCVAASTDEGIVMVDGGHAAWSAGLLDRIEELFTGAPVRALFNTHWHSEQTGSNVTLGQRGAQIIAHENTKLWLGTEVWVRWSDRIYPPLPEAGLPVTTFYDSGRMQFAGRVVQYHYMLNAHTDGDICVYFPGENVLVTGGAVSSDGWPVIDWWTGGWLGGMLDAYDLMLELADENTRIVPSVGPVMSLADLRSQQAMYLTIFDRLQSMIRDAYGTDDVLEAGPAVEFEAEWGDSELFVTLAFQSLWGNTRNAYDRRFRTIP